MGPVSGGEPQTPGPVRNNTGSPLPYRSTTRCQGLSTGTLDLLKLNGALNVDLVPGRPSHRQIVSKDLGTCGIGNDDLIKLRGIRADLGYTGKVSSAVV